jgi:hypothetical protein
MGCNDMEVSEGHGSSVGGLGGAELLDDLERPMPRRVVWNGPEFWLALALTIVVAGFHAVRALHAGGLWRDEAATANLAANFSAANVRESTQHEIFPIALPALAHAVSVFAGTGDSALRGLGAIIGLFIIGALWLGMLSLRRSVPLLSVALLGFNPAFLQWGDSLRGYGLGMFFLLMTTALAWRLMERPNWWRFAVASIAALAAVQSLFNNAVFVLAICAAAALVAMRNRKPSLSCVAVLVGVPAALSLTPYVRFLALRESWDVVVKIKFTFADFLARLDDALAGSGWGDIMATGLLVIAGLGLVMHGQFRAQKTSVHRERDLLLFCGIVLVVSPVLYFIFLKHASYPTQLWYYLPLMAVTALLLDAVAAADFQVRWLRYARPSLALVLALAGIVPTWKQAHVRQTNIDLIAVRLNREARNGDLILVSPWYLGITFQRYYTGEAHWLAVPAISDHQLHRYDLVKAQMLLPNQDQPVDELFAAAAGTLKGGKRVWTVGEFPIPSPHERIPTLTTAPDPKWKWSDRMYTLIWTEKLGAKLSQHATHAEEKNVSAPGPVNPFEQGQLVSYEGWRE